MYFIKPLVDGQQSDLGWPNHFSDMYYTSRSSNAFKLPPVNVTFIIFTEGGKFRIIVSGMVYFDFLPVNHEGTVGEN